jgi:hypothetical protein
MSPATGLHIDLEAVLMKPPLMFVGILVVFMVVLMLVIAYWSTVFPGPYLTSDPLGPK